MATVSAKIFKHHQKTDGTYNIKIRVYHKNDTRFIETTHYVTDKQVTKQMTIKDAFVNSEVNQILAKYRIEIGKLGNRLEFFTAEDLKMHLETKDEEIDFIKFCNEHIKLLKSENREGTAANHTTVKNSIIDYFKRDSVGIMEINGMFLRSFDRFLRGRRSVTRINQLKKEVTTTNEGLKDKGVHNIMRDLRTLFNEARRRYNNEDLGIIKVPHYPFGRYKIPQKPVTRKRNHTIEQIKSIRDSVAKKGSRAELARELYMLSFYLCGINAVDLYKIREYRGNRVEYNRSKTKEKRADNAFISIRVPDEARPLLEKYLGKLSKKYTTFRGLDAALSAGFKQLCQITNIPEITFYWARHSFANIARNKCRKSKDDVAMALNHVDEGNKTTDIYIEKDWGIIDEVQTAVLKLLNDEIKPVSSRMSLKRSA